MPIYTTKGHAKGKRGCLRNSFGINASQTHRGTRLNNKTNSYAQASLYKNFTLIDQLDIDFRNGFSVISGETGAGKSIILGLSAALSNKPIANR
uniref:AAA family ATPase n=1 Tax=Prevotella intermedia TaxID=28131 RepID=UPI001FCA93FF|nr:AAA family ATPase [Prevotella intermedia]